MKAYKKRIIVRQTKTGDQDRQKRANTNNNKENNNKENTLFSKENNVYVSTKRTKDNSAFSGDQPDNVCLEEEQNFEKKKRKKIVFNFEKKRERRRPTEDCFDEGIRAESRLNDKCIEYTSASEDAKYIADLWNDKGCGTVHKKSSKGLEQALYVLDRKIFKKHPVGDVADAICKYAEMMASPQDFKISNRKLSLLNFLQLSRYQRHIANAKGYKLNSMFERMIDSKPIDFLIEKDKRPKLTKTLSDYYNKRFLGGNGTRYSAKQQSGFVKASERLYKFMDSGTLEKLQVHTKPVDYIYLLFNALEHTWGKGGVQVGHLYSDHTYNDVIPRYLAHIRQN